MKGILFRVILSLLIAYNAACRQMSIISAPEHKAEHLASCRMTKLSQSMETGMLPNAEIRISQRLYRSGGGMYSKKSSRPGRISAGSNKSGRLVAATTKIWLFDAMPSSSTKSCARTRSVAALSLGSALLVRRRASASTSSKKTIEGDVDSARKKIPWRARSESPSHMDSNSGPRTVRKLIEHSVAIARASMVFEHPGGP
mmetsp:Transcript_28833/g.98222  ORF Transcript_28833/g.98222 Transcript_28833/m.98222 type:complete len:200 (-) Transcript_28833:1845-2444(-)